MWQGTDE
jgi:hypothetical protein